MARFHCKICGGSAAPFDAVDRLRSCVEGRYPLGISGESILYRRCEDCGFIFTDAFDKYKSEQWASLIYNDDYIKVDPDYVSRRPMQSCGLIESQLSKSATIGLDYGSGTGLMAETLRKQGWIYDACEPYGESRMDPERRGTYNVCSSFEVFEHTSDPLAEMANILALCSPEKLILIIGTNLSDGEVDENRRLSWWYASPRNGHISLFSRESLRRMAARFGLDFSSFGPSTHYLTRGWGAGEVMRMAYVGKARRILKLH